MIAAIKQAVDAQRERDERLELAVEQERVRRQARRLVDAEEREVVEIPDFEILSDALAAPTSPLDYRIESWQPVESRVVLAAQFKSGKTTLVGNVLRSLVDGDLFLGRYHVSPVDGTVGLIDFEMSHRQLVAWLRDQRIRRADRVRLLSMRGRAEAFDIFTAAARRRYVDLFRAARVRSLVIDCGRPILDAFGLDEQKEVGKLTVAIDALMAEAEIPDALVVQHMGHTGERSRGDSKWRDWPDVEWRLVRKDEDPASARFISAYGRDVDVPEQELAYDAATRRLTVVGGSRREAAAQDALEAIAAVLGASTEAMSGRAIKRALEDSDVPRDAVDAALAAGVASGRLRRDEGPRRAKLYRLLSPVSGVSDECPADGVSECPAAYIEPDTRSLTRTESSERIIRTLDTDGGVDVNRI